MAYRCDDSNRTTNKSINLTKIPVCNLYNKIYGLLSLSTLPLTEYLALRINEETPFILIKFDYNILEAGS